MPSYPHTLIPSYPHTRLPSPPSSSPPSPSHPRRVCLLLPRRLPTSTPTLLRMANYLSDHQNRFLDELLDWLRIPSRFGRPQVSRRRAAGRRLLKTRLAKPAPTRWSSAPRPATPSCTARSMSTPTSPRCWCTATTTCSPPTRYDLWTSPPFEPVIKDGKIYARGACDDKGQVYMHVKALEVMMHDRRRCPAT